MLRLFALLVSLTLAATATAENVVFVDNRAAPGGNGTMEHPFATLAGSQSNVSSGTVVYLAETDQPYAGGFTLPRGSMLIGSAYGLDAVRAAGHPDLPPMPEMKGTGPVVNGGIVAYGDNLIAGCTIVAVKTTGIIASGSSGLLDLRNVYYRTSQRAFGLMILGHDGTVSISGGSLVAKEQGGGIAINGGSGNVTVDHFPMTGHFNTALTINNRLRGDLLFRAGSDIDVDDASEDAITVANLPRPVTMRFENVLRIHGHRRGFVASGVEGLFVRAGAEIATVNAAALDLRDSRGSVSFASLSAERADPGTLQEGVVVNHFIGAVSIGPEDVKNVQAGSGGVIRGAAGYGVRFEQSDHVHVRNVTIVGSGTNHTVRGAKCAGLFDSNTTAPCHAALLLRHLADSTFENVLVEGGGAIGVNANNVRDLTFNGLEVRHTGDETYESGFLLQEVLGTVRCQRCVLTDNAGSEMLVEQRFNRGQVVLENSRFAGSGRLDAAPALLAVHLVGAGSLGVDLIKTELIDNSGTAVSAASAATSTLSVRINDSTLQHVGGAVLTATAADASRLTVQVIQTRSLVLTTLDHSLIDVRTTSTGGTCVGLSANSFVLSGGDSPVIKLTASAGAPLQIAGSYDAAALRAANGGVSVAVDAHPAAIAWNATCP